MIIMDLEKVLFREIDNKKPYFCIRKEIVGVLLGASSLFLYSQFNAFDRIYHAYGLALKCYAE